MTPRSEVALVPTIPRAMTTAPSTPELSFGAMVQMGQALCGTGFLPDHIKNGAQAAAIILAGRELGMEPMRALRSLSLVKGKITEAADSQLARFKSDGGRAVFTTLDDSGAVLTLTHPNGDKHTESFTMDDAKKAGLLSSAMYSKFPKAMLRSRAITAALKSIGWEGGSGVYDPSELIVEPVTPERVDDDTGEVLDDAPVLPSEKQTALLAKLLSSHVWTNVEAAKIARKASTSRESMTKALEYVLAETKTRKAAETVADDDGGSLHAPTDDAA